MPDELYGRSLWREHTCQTCKQKFKASRIDAQYCSPRCRQYWKRHGAPYPSVGTPEQVGPGLFDGVPAETAATPEVDAKTIGTQHHTLREPHEKTARVSKANKSRKPGKKTKPKPKPRYKNARKK
jgi:hypothetical protein